LESSLRKILQNLGLATNLATASTFHLIPASTFRLYIAGYVVAKGIPDFDMLHSRTADHLAVACAFDRILSATVGTSGTLATLSDNDCVYVFCKLKDSLSLSKHEWR
jgi:hypothetical protein